MLDYQYIKNCYRLITDKLKSVAKSNTGTTLRISKKNFQDEKLPHKLFLTTRQKTKARNVFTNNTSMDISLCKAKLSNIIQSGRFIGKTLGNSVLIVGFYWNESHSFSTPSKIKSPERAVCYIGKLNNVKYPDA